MAAAEAALLRGRAQGALTILNPAPVRPLPAAVLQAVDILTPNEVEAKVLAGESGCGDWARGNCPRIDS